MKELSPQVEKSTYINVMESLVVQEVRQQLQHLPARVRRYIRVDEVVTYALNRLPALYASSEKGWQYQRQLAKRDLQKKTKAVVRQAIAAVQVDPIRLSQPIQAAQNTDAESVLQMLRAVFKTPDLNWSTALEKLKTAPHPPQQAEPVPAKNHGASPCLPTTYGGEVTWMKHRRQPAIAQTEPAGHARVAVSTPVTAWDDARYRL
ncbi:MAG: late competence development ComFB family protein [Leptolyngbya sp. SIO1E4]|nr:late competence development ComFB family protein [Leptolyngbya sp. SIO1E4]